MMIDPATFRCARCGACCRVPGYVALEAGEPDAIAAFLGIDVYAFTEAYTTLTLNRSVLSLTEQDDGRCVFLQDDNSCRIQPVKPTQCKGFPFLWRTKKLERDCAAMRNHSTTTPKRGPAMNNMLTLTLLSFITLAGAAGAQQPVPLFDGKTLQGWKVVTCEAEVVDGAILLKAGNGFLQADKEYGDFIFECDWKALNTNMWDSGVYFRAGLPSGKFPWPKEHQVNMRRGQEGSISGADKAKAASLYKPGEWNHFKLTVKGKTAELIFNGEKAWSRDGIEPAKGLLCLQAEVPGGGQFLFKNITILDLETQPK